MAQGAKSSLKKFMIIVMSPVLAAVGLLFIGIYKLFFGWWLDPRTSRKLEKEFAKEIRDNLGFLFEKLGGNVIPNTRKYPQVADYAVVTVAVENILLRFIRGRGEFRVDVAPVESPNDWREVGEVLAASDGYRGVGVPEYFRFADFGRLLFPNFELLVKAASSETKSLRPREVRLTRLH